MVLFGVSGFEFYGCVGWVFQQSVRVSIVREGMSGVDAGKEAWLHTQWSDILRIWISGVVEI